MKKLKAWINKNPLKSMVIVVMLYTLIGAALLRPAKASEFDVKSFLSKTYVTVGIAHKVQETELTHFTSDGGQYSMNDPTTARLEIGYQYSENLTFGISHHSQYFSNAPFNNREEYSKTEIFIDYKFYLGDFF